MDFGVYVCAAVVNVYLLPILFEFEMEWTEHTQTYKRINSFANIFFVRFPIVVMLFFRYDNDDGDDDVREKETRA